MPKLWLSYIHIHHDLASLEATPQAAKAEKDLKEDPIFDQDTVPATDTQVDDRHGALRSSSPTPSQATDSTLRTPSSVPSVVWLTILIFLGLFIALSFYFLVSLRPQVVVTHLFTFCQHDIYHLLSSDEVSDDVVKMYQAGKLDALTAMRMLSDISSQSTSPKGTPSPKPMPDTSSTVPHGSSLKRPRDTETVESDTDESMEGEEFKHLDLSHLLYKSYLLSKL